MLLEISAQELQLVHTDHAAEIVTVIDPERGTMDNVSWLWDVQNKKMCLPAFRSASSDDKKASAASIFRQVRRG